MIKWLINTFLGKWLYKRFENRVRSLCYSSIKKLPITNWWAINEGEIEAVYKDEYRELKKGHAYIMAQIIVELYKEFINEFGIGEEEGEIMDKKWESHIYYMQYLSGDKSKLTDYEIAEKELINMTKEQRREPANLVEIIASVESSLHVTIDIDKCTTERFYGYMKLIKKRNKK